MCWYKISINHTVCESVWFMEILHQMAQIWQNIQWTPVVWGKKCQRSLENGQSSSRRLQDNSSSINHLFQLRYQKYHLLNRKQRLQFTQAYQNQNWTTFLQKSHLSNEFQFQLWYSEGTFRNNPEYWIHLPCITGSGWLCCDNDVSDTFLAYFRFLCTHKT